MLNSFYNFALEGGALKIRAENKPNEPDAGNSDEGKTVNVEF